jgi:LysM repeat protein
MKTKFIIFILALLAGTILATGTSQAVNTGTVGILPAYPDTNIPFSNSWFIYNLGLGQAKRDAVRVLNNRAETIVVKLYAVDATTTTDGSFAPLGEQDAKQDLGSWIKLGANEVEVPPNSEKLVPFEVSIPKNADVGDHIGAVVLQELETGANLEGTGTKIITRVAVRMYETVPGTIRKDFDITRLDWRMDPTGHKNFLKDFLDINNQTAFLIGLKNNGNVKLTPRVTVDVKNMFGRTVAHLADQEVGTLFPNRENRDGMITWSGMPLIGRYTAKATVSFVEGGTDEKTQEISFWVFPYRIAFLLVLLFVLEVLMRLIWKYRLEVSKEKMPIYEAKTGDTLLTLASRFQLSWKKLAKTNEIKKPYHINAGEKLFVPITRRNRQLLMELFQKRELLPAIDKGAARSGIKKVAIWALVFVVIIGGWLYWQKTLRGKQNISRMVGNPNQKVEVPQETAEKTITGAFKKSSVTVGIITPAGGDLQSSQRLLNRFLLEGYSVKLLGASENKYQKTTVEYLTGKKDQAQMVANDLGLTDQVDLVETAGLSQDAIVYNFVPRDQYIELNYLSSDLSAQRDLIKVTILNGGADDSTVKSASDAISLGGFGLQGDVGQAASSDYQNLTITYTDDSQAKNADALKNYLAGLGYTVNLSKNIKGESGSVVILIVGKI